MAKSKIFFVLSFCFLAGVFAASFFSIENYLILIFVASGAAIFLVDYKNKKTMVAGVAILFLALGAWRTNVSLENTLHNLANSKIGPAEFSGTVAKEPETDEKYQKIVVENEQKNKILINADIYPKYDYGDELKISCVLQKPPDLRQGFGGRGKNFSERFDYQMYLAKDGIYWICSKAKMETLARNRGNKAYAVVLAIKNKFEEKLSAIFPDPEGAYLKGLLLGGSKRMTEDFSEAFRRTGTSHTVAVSGYNVAIVAAFLMWAGIWLGLWRQQVFSFAVVGIILFVLATGAPSSAVRAGIMGALVIWAMKEGRLANSTNAILLAAGVMLAINPLLLRYDAGFQLSFLATFGIVYLSPVLENFWIGKPSKFIRETVILTMAATIFVLPVILNSFENLSLVSPVANFLILPAIPVMMGMGFAAGMAGFVFVSLGKLVGFAPYILLKIELWLVEWMAGWSWASIEVKNFGWQYVAAYYAILFCVIYRARKSESKFF